MYNHAGALHQCAHHSPVAAAWDGGHAAHAPQLGDHVVDECVCLSLVEGECRAACQQAAEKNGVDGSVNAGCSGVCHRPPP